MLRTEIFETKTGRPRLLVPAADAPWTRRLTGNGSCRFQFKLDHLKLPAATIDDLFYERARSIAIHDGTTSAYQGIILSTEYDDDTATLSVETHEARVYARWRMLAGVNNITAATLEADGLSAAAAAGFVAERSMGWNGWELPIRYTKTGTGDFRIDNQWYEFRYAEDLFQEIEKRGYEIDWHPVRLSSGWFEWVMRVAPKITSGVMTLPKRAGKSPLVGLKVRTSSTNQVTGVLAAGAGEGTDKKTAWAGDAFAEGIPTADVIEEAGDVSDPVKLQQIASAAFTERRKRTEQWSFDLRLNDPQAPVTLEQALPGRGFDIDVRGNRRIPDGQYRQRVIALAGSLGRTVTPEVQAW